MNVPEAKELLTWQNEKIIYEPYWEVIIYKSLKFKKLMLKRQAIRIDLGTNFSCVEV